MTTLLWLWMLVARVTIAVTPRVMQVGATIRITCTVPRHADNRWLTIAVPGSGYSSTRQLDGEAEKITHVAYVQHMECGEQVAVCDVADNLDRHFVASTQLTVAGCEE